MKDILKFLEERKLTQEEAIKILEKNLPYQYAWKIWRFTLYLWKRIENEKKGIKTNKSFLIIWDLVLQDQSYQIF